MLKPRLGGILNHAQGVYPQSTATDKRLHEVAEILEKCSLDTELGEYYIRCEDCQEFRGCERLWLYMVEKSTNHGIHLIQEADFDIFILNFTLISERLNGNNGDRRIKWVKSDQLYSA